MEKENRHTFSKRILNWDNQWTLAVGWPDHQLMRLSEPVPRQVRTRENRPPPSCYSPAFNLHPLNNFLCFFLNSIPLSFAWFLLSIGCITVCDGNQQKNVFHGTMPRIILAKDDGQRTTTFDQNSIFLLLKFFYLGKFHWEVCYIYWSQLWVEVGDEAIWEYIYLVMKILQSAEKLSMMTIAWILSI